MKSTKLLKLVLIPTLGISAIVPIAAVSTSCGPEKQLPYVALTANANSTLTFVHNYFGEFPDLQYSTDATSWSTYSEEISINQGQTLYLKGNNHTGWSTSYSVYSSLSITGDVSISGNVMGLLDNGAKPGEQGDITGIPCDYCFYNLFRDSTGITRVSENFLPATTLAEDCYQNIFYNCTSLTTAPELPATTLAEDCYQNMFYNCTSLTTAPELPATTLANYCYNRMFDDCTSLTAAPELPATTLEQGCYQYMFRNCTSLTTAPELPAMNLTSSCYLGMFYNCLALDSIKIGYDGYYNSSYFNSWVEGVASSGTFYYNGIDLCASFGLRGWTKEPFN